MALPRREKIKSDGWKDVELEGAFLNSEVDGLIGIEELTDYKLEDSKIICTNAANGKKV